jgi:uncharacterized SAM-binding protein YcdF (DUF218 family)
VRADAGRARSGLRALRVLGALALGLLAVIALTPAANWLATRYGEPARLAPADAIVALGGGISPDGSLDNPSWRRLVHGVLLHRRGLAPLVVLSGTTPRGRVSEPEVRGGLARELGLPPEAILAVIGANTTHEEALLVGAPRPPRGVQSILLVSSPLHLVRARQVFERQGFEVHPAPVEDVLLRAQRPGARLAVARAVVKELVGLLYYRLAGYL